MSKKDNDLKVRNMHVSKLGIFNVIVGFIAFVIGILMAVDGGLFNDSIFLISGGFGCIVLGTILQSLKTICFYLREIYKRMD